MRMWSAVLAVLVVVSPALVVAAPADARRPPTKQERKAVVRALNDATPGGPCGEQAATSCRRVVRISTVRDMWSAVYIRPRHGYERAVPSENASLKLKDGTWRVKSAGHGGGCGIPAKVRRDLKLDCY